MLPLCPVKNYELESCVIAEMYKRKASQLTFFQPSKTGTQRMTLLYSEAFALNDFMSDHSSGYNIFIKPQLEPFLPKGKP